MTDLALDHRLVQRTLGSSVGGLDSIGLQERQHPTCHLLQLLADAHRYDQRRSSAPLEGGLLFSALLKHAEANMARRQLCFRLRPRR